MFKIITLRNVDMIGKDLMEGMDQVEVNGGETHVGL
jgi:hypothetical protein